MKENGTVARGNTTPHHGAALNTPGPSDVVTHQDRVTWCSEHTRTQ